MLTRFVNACWHDQDGVLSFEWTLLAVLLVIGIVGGVAGARDAIIDEFGDTAEAMLAWDQSYSFSGIASLGIAASSYTDPGHVYEDCGRNFLGPVNYRDDNSDGG